MLHQRADFLVGRLGGERDGRLLARLARGVFGVFGTHPLPAGDEAGKRLRQFGEQRLAGRHRQVVARHERLADRRQMAETFDDAVDGERRNIGVRILQKRKTRLRRADLGDGRGQRARQHGAAGDCHLRFRMTGGDQVDQIVFREQRRSRQNRQRDFRLIGGKRVHHDARRFLRGSEHLGERAPHQRRRIVEQHDHRAFGGGKIVGRQIGMKIGAGERGCGFRPFTGRGAANPLQKLTNNHGTTRRYEQPSRTRTERSQLKPTRLNKAFTIEIEAPLTIR